MQSDPAFAREALRAGALGYVLKEAADAELVEAVGLPPGGTYLHPELAPRLAAEPSTVLPDGLTEREVEVLQPDRARTHQQRDRRPALPERQNG